MLSSGISGRRAPFIQRINGHGRITAPACVCVCGRGNDDPLTSIFESVQEPLALHGRDGHHRRGTGLSADSCAPAFFSFIGFFRLLRQCEPVKAAT